MLPFVLYVLIVLLIGCYGSELNECNYERERRSIVCKNILGTFPDVAYGHYRLECENCDIKIFSPHIFPYKNSLTSFNVSSSGLEYIATNAFSNLKNCQFFYLQDNKIMNISQGAFSGLRQVYELHLENNYISNLQLGFLDNVEVNALSLSHNKIEELPNNIFAGSLGMLTLELQNNVIKKINRHSFLGLDNIEYLILENNQLCFIPMGAFSYLKTLKHLNLSNNKFKRFALGTFSGLKNLETLSLAHNQISDFDGSFLIPFNHLSKLDITGNGIYYFDAHSVYRNVPTVKFIHLDGNIFSCSLLSNILQYFKTVNVEVISDMEQYDLQNINGIICIDNIITVPIKYDYFISVAKKETKNSGLYC